MIDRLAVRAVTLCQSTERRRFDRRAGLAPERWILGNSREWSCSRAVGSVLEVGVGTGLNMAHYPGRVERAEAGQQVRLSAAW